MMGWYLVWPSGSSLGSLEGGREKVVCAGTGLGKPSESKLVPCSGALTQRRGPGL